MQRHFAGAGKHAIFRRLNAKAKTMPNDYKRTVLIGDSVPERALLLKRVIEDDFLTDVVCVESFDSIKRKIFEAREKDRRWKVVLMAGDLPLTEFIRDPIQSEQFSFVQQMEAVISLGCVYSTTEPPPLPDAISLINVPPTPIRDEHRRILFQNIRNAPGIRLIPAPDLPEIELDRDPVLMVEDLVLREQIRSLDSGRDFKKAAELIAYLIRNFKSPGCNKFIVSRMGQGASGASVFRFRPSRDGLDINERVLKITTHDKQWKLLAEVEKHFRAKETLGHRYRRHVADIETFNRDGIATNIASHQDWRAIAYDFLGENAGNKRNKFGKFIDLELALIGSLRDLQEKSRDTEFAQYFANDLTLANGRKHILESVLNWLCENWYLRGVPVSIETSLWNYDDGPDDEFLGFPPYRLARKSKLYILSFLDSREAKLGERFFSDWKDRHQRVREFVVSDVAQMASRYSLHHAHSVILSPTHGDLNANNLLLGMEDAHPFLIDFPFYQDAGHALQDLARLEVEIKLTLMDRQDSCPPEKLRAFDYTHSQMPLWEALEDYLISDQPGALLSLPENIYDENVRLSYDLIEMIRAKARRVQARNKEGKLQFWNEYRLPLLFHSLKAITYQSLSVFKRLLAVRSSASLLEQSQIG
jgi:hypothetical protein